jgi:tRNA (guanine-N7-)-methyltransferase
VLRQGRTTEAQSRALAELWPRFGLEYRGTARDLAQCFGRAAPVVLEIGFGNGEQLLLAAQADPGRNYLGVEVHRPGVGRLLRALARAGVENVRIIWHDAVEVLQHEIGAGALAEIRIYFPDPWPKKRQQKRRLIQPDFVQLLIDKLAGGGRLHLATDWQDYADHMRAVLDACPLLVSAQPGGAHVPRPDWRAETHFERRGIKLGHSVSDLLYQRL